MSRRKKIVAGTAVSVRASQRNQLIVGMLLLIMIGLAVWYPALQTTARTFDDDQYFYSNPLVQQPSWESAQRFLGEVLNPSTVAGYYQPLSMISLMLDVAMGASETNVAVFHHTSMVLHICNVLLVFLILWWLFQRVWTAWFSSLVFLCHPMVTETITWIGERKTTLAAFFGLLTILLYLISVRRNRAGYRWLAVGTFVLALMAKPTVLALPIGLLILDRWPLDRFFLTNWKQRLLEKMPFFMVMLISAVIAFISQDQTSGTMTPTEQGGMDTIFYKMAYNIILYLQHFFYPTGLTAHYPIPDPFHISNPEVMWICVAALIVVGGIAWTLRGTRAPFYGMLYAMVVLLPASGIIGFNNVIGSDKYMYFPMLGYLIVVCWLAGMLHDRWISRTGGDGYVLRGAAMLPMVAVMVYLVFFQTQYIAKWTDTETFYHYMIGFAPKAAPLHYDLAMEYMRKKQTADAITHYELAAQRAPDNNWIQTNLGIAYFEAGQNDLAIKTFSRALELEPNDAFAANNLGILYMKKNDDVNALSWFIKAAKIKPDFFDPIYNRGIIYDRMDMLDLAMGSFQEAYKLNPGVPSVHYDMGRMFEKKGMVEQALTMYQQTQQMQPDYPGVAEKIAALSGK